MRGEVDEGISLVFVLFEGKTAQVMLLDVHVKRSLLKESLVGEEATEQSRGR